MASLGEAFASDDVRRMERFFSVLAALTGVLRTREGRKEVFLFSDGFAINPEAIYSTLHPRRRTDDLLRTTREASAGRVVLNPVSTLGLTAPAPWSGLAALFTRTLSALALNTGGVLVHGVNSHFEAPMRKIEEQSRVTYQLAYAPEGEPDGKLHSTRVVVRRKELEVRAQEGYLWMTEAQRRERETISAYAAPELFRAIPVSLLVRTYLEEDGKPMVEVAIALSESSLLLLPREGRRTAHLEAGGLLRSTDGKVEKRFSRNVKARLPRKADAEARDLTLLARQPVPPGEYEAVVVVRDLDSGEVGAARMPVKVPALSPEHLAMSSLVLSRPGLGLGADRSRQARLRGAPPGSPRGDAGLHRGRHGERLLRPLPPPQGPGFPRGEHHPPRGDPRPGRPGPHAAFPAPPDPRQGHPGLLPHRFPPRSQGAGARPLRAAPPGLGRGGQPRRPPEGGVPAALNGPVSITPQPPSTHSPTRFAWSHGTGKPGLRHPASGKWGTPWSSPSGSGSTRQSTHRSG